MFLVNLSVPFQVQQFVSTGGVDMQGMYTPIFDGAFT